LRSQNRREFIGQSKERLAKPELGPERDLFVGKGTATADDEKSSELRGRRGTVPVKQRSKERSSPAPLAGRTRDLGNLKESYARKITGKRYLSSFSSQEKKRSR